MGSVDLELKKFSAIQQDADGIAQIEELKEEDIDESSVPKQKGVEENEDAFFDELDLDMIDEGVTTNNITTFDKVK